MKKVKNKVIIISALLCTVLLSQIPYTVQAVENPNIESTVVNTDLGYREDFYNTVNAEWLKNAKIAQGMNANSSFVESYDNTTMQIKNIINELLTNEKYYDENSDEKKMINLYKNTLNMEARNKQGTKAIKEIIDEVSKIKSVNDLANLDIDSKISNVLIGIGIDTDLKDVNSKALYIGNTGLSLGNSDEYTKPNEDSEKRKTIKENYFIKVLKLSGYSDEVAKAKVDNLFKYENMIAPYIAGREETAKDDNAIDKKYNVYTLDELDKMAPNVNIKTIAKNYKVSNAKKIILTEPKWLEELNKIYTDDNLPMFKDAIEVRNILSVCNYLGQDFVDAGIEFNNAYTGSQGDVSEEEKGISMVSSALPDALGRLYSEKYCSKEVKEDVSEIINEIIETYKVRIENLDWMSYTTKKKAIEKLNAIVPKVAYPERWDDYSKVEIKSFEEGGSLLDNLISLKKFNYYKSVEELNEPVDKTVFACSPQTVNAFYDPTTNSITIPAGILQGEFYNKDNSKEKNLGAIGCIIGHEISHAFDNTGAKFDCDGNLNNWWTEEDYNNFKEKTDKVRAFYSTVKTDNGDLVNGDLTVGENISDISGVACCLDIMNKMYNPNYDEFFQSQARVWREIATDEYNSINLKYDEHSPNKVRTNIVLAQFEEFYKTYGIKQGDKMYIKPEERLRVW